MMGSISYHTLTKAAAKHADVKMQAGGNEEGQLKAVQMLKGGVGDDPAHYSFSMPREPGADLQ